VAAASPAAGPLRDVANWVGQYRRHWEESFERPDAYLPGMVAGAIETWDRLEALLAER
jgi:hypothetical protein